ncbi:hypothetical protein TNCV_2572391 [Trichonephila clavipes]|nr:hypothetical protein TNCV_2572391 [Trichonephila clavipes]
MAVQLLKRLKFQFYTIKAKAERPIKVVIKGLPRNTNPEEIKQDLELLEYTPERVNQLIGRKNKRPLPIFLITLPRNLDNLKIFDLKPLSYLSIRVEGYDDNWKEAIIFPINKPGKDPHLASSYRPITHWPKTHHPDEEPKPRLPDSIARPIANMPLSRKENTTFALPSIIDSHDMGLRTVFTVQTPKRKRLFNDKRRVHTRKELAGDSSPKCCLLFYSVARQRATMLDFM